MEERSAMTTKPADIARIRNIGVIAHIDAGKTTLSERMLYYSHGIHRMGEVHDGTATMDFMPEEQARGITVSSACTTCLWNDAVINLVDTPGHVDFTIEVERALRVMDGAIGVFCAVGGVEPQSETVWRQSERFAMPKIAFINKEDRPGANFSDVLDAMRIRLKAPVAAVTIPVNEGPGLSGIFDLVHESRLGFSEADLGATVTVTPATSEEKETLRPWRDVLLEKLAEADDVFLGQWMEGHFTEEDILQALRRATIARTIVPVYCGSALRNIGVQPLMDAVATLLPSPIDVPTVDLNGKTLPASAAPGVPLAALVFKLAIENGHRTAFVRIYSGMLKEGDRIFNATCKKQDSIGRIFRPHANRRENLPHARAGDIVIVTGMRHAHTGDTCTSPGNDTLLEDITRYEPVVTIALEPRNTGESAPLDEALARYAEEDPTLRTSIDEGSGARIVSGMGTLHLEILRERLLREYRLSPRAGAPQVVQRESICRKADASAQVDKVLGHEHLVGAVALTVSPMPRASGTQLALPDGLEPAFSEAVRASLAAGLQNGVLAGWPLADVSVTVTEVTTLNASPAGCAIAAAQALKTALEQAEPVLLEPIMRVEITAPEAALGPAVTLLTSCQGSIDAMGDDAGRKTICGHAPMRRMFDFSDALRSATQGRASLSLIFDRYDRPARA